VVRTALVLLAALAGCASRPASLPPPVDASQVTVVPAPPPAPPPPPPSNPRLPPTPELVALPGGRAIPAPLAGAPPPGGPRGETVGAARGLIPGPPAIGATPAESDGCFIPANAVTTQLDMRRPDIAQDRGRATLAAMTGRPPEGGMHVAGVYRSSLRVRVGLRIATAPNGCLVPSAQVIAEVQRGIYVASELAPGTCRYEVVLGHEREHARIDDVLLGDLEGWFAAPLRRMLAEPGALRGSAQELSARLQARFEQARRAFDAARQQAQLSIDTPQEYARASRACPG
jgi:hypothetical protein